MSLPPTVRIVRLPCTGKVDSIHILKAFEKGADAIFVAGCMEGDCHFQKGNIRARKRVELVRGILDETGIGGKRVRMYNLSSSQAGRFKEITEEMTQIARDLGPNPMRRIAAAGGGSASAPAGCACECTPVAGPKSGRA